MLHFADGSPFSCGVCALSCRPIRESDSSLRILIPVKIGNIETQAVVDTGGVYLCCDKQTAQDLRLDPAVGLETLTLIGGMGKIRGSLHRISLTLVPDRGQGLELQVTAFIPHQDEIWNLPSLLGFQGCLERLRFAIDMTTDSFYFGPIDEAPQRSSL
jgi:hypothetical protein